MKFLNVIALGFWAVLAASAATTAGFSYTSNIYVLNSDSSIAVFPAHGGTPSTIAESCDCRTASDLALDSSGNFIIATGGQLLKVTPAGASSTIALPPQNSQFFSVAVDARGNYIVADNGQHRIVRISQSGALAPVASYSTGGTVAGTTSENVYINIDAKGNYIIAEDAGGTFSMFSITPDGGVSPISLSGTAMPAQVGGLTFDTSGNYMVPDRRNGIIYSITPAGVVTQFYPAAGSTGGSGNSLVTPVGITLDYATGVFFVADPEYPTLDAISPDGSSFSTPVSNSPLANPVAVATSVSTTQTPVCPTTSYTNTDCAFIYTINSDGSASASRVLNAAPYDGDEDALVGVVNNSGKPFTGSFTLTGVYSFTGGSEGIFDFDGDGICYYIGAGGQDPNAAGYYCGASQTAGNDPADYAGPLVTFSNIITKNVFNDTGTVNITNLPAGATTFFSLEGTPADITGPSLPPPVTASVQTVSYPNFSSTAGLTINGNATTATTGDGTVIRLTQALEGQAGSFFSTNSISFPNAADTFSTFFQFRFTSPSTPPADGIVFVLQPVSSSLGAGGGSEGYGGITPSIGVEFDTFQNGGSDINGNHVAVLMNGQLNDINLQTPYGVSECNSPTGVFGCMANGDLWSVWIDYDGTNLHVAVADNSTVRPTDLITYPLASIASILGTNTAYAGFTGGTGLYYENQDIVDWIYTNTYRPIAGPITAPTLPAFPPLTLSASGSPGTVSAGHPLSVTFAASGGKPPYTFVPYSSLPSGLTLNGNTLTGAPSQPGNYSVGIEVIDAQPMNTVTFVQFSVFGITTGTSLPNAVAYSGYSQSLSAAGGSGSYTFSGSGFPPGISMSSSGVISGTTISTGTFSIPVKVTDSAGNTYSATFSLTVVPPPALKITSAVLPGANIGVHYSQALSATGGVPPYNWSVTAGTLPPGFSLSATGVLSGTPALPGTVTFTVQALDASGATATAGLSITTAPPPLTVTASNPFPSGMVGVNYPTQYIQASGGSTPYTYAISSGALPAGLTLGNDGSISGTPSAAGNFSATVTVKDVNNSTGSVSIQGTVRPSAAELMLSTGSLTFNLMSGATAPPASQAVQVQSTVVGTVLPWSTSVAPAAPWMSIAPASGSTPGAFNVSITSQGLNLTPSTTPYQTTITVTCGSGSPCAGKSLMVAISLTVTAAPPQLSVFDTLLSFSSGGESPVTSLNLHIGNTGGGSMGISSISSAASWAQVGPYPTQVASGTTVPVPISIDATGLTTGFYRTTITILSAGGTVVVPVTLFVTNNPDIFLEPAGSLFQISAGGPPETADNNFLVDVSSSTPINWTASVLPGASWLSVTTPGGSSTLSKPGTVQFAIDPTIAASLTPQAYYGRIEITADGVVNSPLDFEVVLNVLPANAPQQPTMSPEGLLFITTATSAPPPQTVQVFANSATASAYQVSVSTTDGQNWLSVDKTTGVAAPVALSQISVNPQGLAAGVYRGSVTYAFATAGVRTDNITLLVTSSAAASSPAAERLSLSPRASCTPKQLVPAQTGLVNNFSAAAAWPVPVAINLVNDCGNPVNNGQIVATFSNGDPPLALTLADPSQGLYSATWTPRHTGGQITVTGNATAVGFPPATVQYSGTVTPNNAPVLTPGATLHIFTPQVGAALGPGTIIQIYGQYLAAQTGAAATIPLPNSLAGTQVIIGGIPAPLYFASPGQINAQVPFELKANQQYQVIVSANGALTTPDNLQLSPVSPGIATYGSGTAVAQHGDGSLVTEANPAKPGEYLVMYVSGFGATTVPVSSGAASPTTPLAQPLAPPVLTINGEQSTILFAGLTPGLVGLYQVNFQVPADASNGDLNTVLLQGGIQSNSTILPVHK